MGEPTRKITKTEEKKALKAYERMLENPDLIMWIEAVIRRYDSAENTNKKSDEGKSEGKGRNR